MNSPRTSNTQGGYLPSVSNNLNGYPSSGLSRKGWQDLVSSYTGMGVSASDAAHRAGSYYTAQNERGNRQYGYSNQNRMLNPNTPLVPAADQAIVDMTMRQLGAKKLPNGKWYGLDAIGYQTALTELSRRGVGPSGLSGAARASHVLKQVYDSQADRPHYSPRQWQNAISQYSERTGASASQAAQALGSHYSAPGEYNRSPVYNPTVSTVSGYSNMNNQQSAAPGDFGMYGGLGGSYPAGTVAKPGDVVLNKDQASVIQALQATSPNNYPGFPANSPGYLNESDVRSIAEALGLSTEGNRVALVAAIKNRVRQMSQATQTQFMGGLSPRSQQFVGGLSSPLNRSPSPQFQTM